MQSRRFGLSTALLLPIRENGDVNLGLLVEHASWCVDKGSRSVTVFGTTGEGTSIGMSGRAQILGALLAAGFDPRRQIVGGVSANSIHDALDQARLVLDADCRALLVLPSFYFKDVDDDGLFRWFAGIIEKLGGRARDVIVYNIPGVSGIKISLDLVARLRTAFPDQILGVKDSSGDWDYTRQLLSEHGDLVILIGDERHLAEGVRLGAEGMISGLGNICPELCTKVLRSGEADRRLSELSANILNYPVVPAVKAIVAHVTGRPEWKAVRPPLTPLSSEGSAALATLYDGLFSRQTA